jgi:hypothetical protein
VPSARDRLVRLGLPPTLAVETTFALVGVVSVAVFVAAGATDPGRDAQLVGFVFLLLGAVSFGIVWLTLGLHAVVDLTRLVGRVPAYRRDGPPRPDGRECLHIGFRLLESGAVALLPVSVWLLRRTVETSLPGSHAPRGAFPTLVGSVAIPGLVVLVHGLVTIAVASAPGAGNTEPEAVSASPRRETDE